MEWSGALLIAIAIATVIARSSCVLLPPLAACHRCYCDYYHARLNSPRSNSRACVYVCGGHLGVWAAQGSLKVCWQLSECAHKHLPSFGHMCNRLWGCAYIQPQQHALQQPPAYNLHHLPPIVCEILVWRHLWRRMCALVHIRLLASNLKILPRLSPSTSPSPLHQLSTRHCQLWFRAGGWRLLVWRLVADVRFCPEHFWSHYGNL